MDGNTLLILLAGGTFFGALIGILMCGDGYGWIFNSISGALGAVFGTQLLAATGADMGLWLNAVFATSICAATTAMVLRT